MYKWTKKVLVFYSSDIGQLWMIKHFYKWTKKVLVFYSSDIGQLWMIKHFDLYKI